MVMNTRCPQCGATFKVQAEQLRLRGGLVRCGNCAAVFDGYACLTSADEPLPRRQPPAVLRNRADMLRHSAQREQDVAVDDDDEGMAPDRAREPAMFLPDGAPPSSAAPFVWRTRRVEAPAAGANLQAADGEDSPILARMPEDDGFAPRPADGIYPGRDPVAAPSPAFLDDDLLQRARLRRQLWGWACVLALLLAVGQGLLVYRTQLALAVPALRPALELLCQPLQCKVGYARRAERISIMSSSLQPPPAGSAGANESGRPDAGRPDAGRPDLILHVVLRNRYTQPQEWPALMLSLTDLSDTVVARRMLTAADYLPAGRQRGPLAAGEEVTLAVPLRTGGLSVNGYQIDKFFP
ncbi:Probable transmembrane protein [plant metagenome]|uniref:Probable transmembrane protein n=1 Tax=plant metagenome TaxID=1297885 RepID=A0A484QIK9_9ZZZZ